MSNTGKLASVTLNIRIRNELKAASDVGDVLTSDLLNQMYLDGTRVSNRLLVEAASRIASSISLSPQLAYSRFAEFYEMSIAESKSDQFGGFDESDVYHVLCSAVQSDSRFVANHLFDYYGVSKAKPGTFDGGKEFMLMLDEYNEIAELYGLPDFFVWEHKGTYLVNFFASLDAALVRRESFHMVDEILTDPIRSHLHSFMERLCYGYDSGAFHTVDAAAYRIALLDSYRYRAESLEASMRKADDIERDLIAEAEEACRVADSNPTEESCLTAARLCRDVAAVATSAHELSVSAREARNKFRKALSKYNRIVNFRYALKAATTANDVAYNASNVAGVAAEHAEDM